LYELFKKLSLENSTSNINFATKKDKDIIMKYMNKALNEIEFSTKEKKETQKIVWKRVIGKAMLTKREAFAVMGFLRKLEK
jgi:tRNA C32,U32 (ribose-2'-O)-methylase TrmJ